MGRMPDIEAEAARAVGWAERHLIHHHTSAAPATAAVTIKPTTGAHMSLAADLHNVATRLENIGEEGLTIAEAISRNPEAQAIAGDLAHLAGLSLPAGTLTQVAGALKAVLSLVYPAPAAATAQQPAAAPAGPAVAGQAR